MAPRLPGPHDFLASGAGAALASRHASQPICADAVARSRSVLASPDPEPTIDAAAGPSAHARDVHAGARPVAVLLVGLLRTFVREDVHRSIKTNLVDSLAGVGASDVYLRVGPDARAEAAINATYWRVTRATLAYACSDMSLVHASLAPQNGGLPGCAELTAEGRLSGKAVGCHWYELQLRLSALYSTMESVEAAHRRRYGSIVVSRPDLVWDAPVPADLLTHGRVYYMYDMVALCPRAVATASWPCNFGCNGLCSGGGGPALRTARQLGPPSFQIHFARASERATEVELMIEGFSYMAGMASCRSPGKTTGLFGAVRSLDAPAAASCVMDFIAMQCRRYDAHLAHVLRHHTRRRADLSADLRSQTAEIAEVRASPAFGVFSLLFGDNSANDPMNPPSAAELAGAIARLPGLMCVSANSPAEKLSYVPSHRDASATSSATLGPRVPSLEAQCGLRSRYCAPRLPRVTTTTTTTTTAAAAAGGEDADVARYVRTVCDHNWRLPPTSAQLFYHHPAVGRWVMADPRDGGGSCIRWEGSEQPAPLRGDAADSHRWGQHRRGARVNRSGARTTY